MTLTPSLTQLLTWNTQGLIPGPNESVEAFEQRATLCLSLKQSVITELKEQLPFVETELSDDHILIPAERATQELFDISPRWIPLFFSNYQLLPWHGGCAWIFQTEPNSPKMAFFQLRKAFATHETYLGFYHRDELITHELAHVGRMAFEEPKYEEIIAYQSSHSPFRRWLGPLLQSAYEALILFGLLVICLIVDLFALFLAQPGAFTAALWWKLLPVSYLAYLLVRLTLRQRTFRRCKKRLTEATGSLQNAQAVIYRLTDEEIARFASLTPDKIRTEAQTYAIQSPRWQVIAAAYFQ
jgi:hypothetical protein